MKEYFYSISDYVFSLIKKDEIAFCYLQGENSEFARFNKAKIRQNGFVNQWYLEIALSKGKKHAEAQVTFSGDEETDKNKAVNAINILREKLNFISDDPFFTYSANINSNESINKNVLPKNEEVISQICKSAQNKDLAGLYMAGGIFAGFANSLGQKNWFEKYSFDFSWSVYHSDDKAAKQRYSGFKWDDQMFENKMKRSLLDLEIVSKNPITIKPGKYRVYLSPSALSEFVGFLKWRGVGLKLHKEKNTPLIKMTEEGKTLNSSISIHENVESGVGPLFLRTGYIKTPRVSVIKNGKFENYLVSPRSSLEYKVPHNGANDIECFTSAEMDAGNLDEKNILKELGTGIYINDVWYLSVSDVMSCRMTGMTRFATFWVENGEIKAPINVMRFDESLYDMLGNDLVGMTKNKEFIMSDESYVARSTDSFNLPGILVKDFNFTL